MWETALLVMALQSIDAAQTGFSCNFPADSAEDRGVTLMLDDRPSLIDQPGLFRVELRMNGDETLRATAQPIETTGGRDALVVARPKTDTVLTVGFRDDGKAALSLRDRVTGSEQTMVGTCRGFEGPLNRWLAS